MSNRTGELSETLDAEHWAQHLLEPVRFHRSVELLLHAGHRLFLEIGPGRTLSSLAKRSTRGEATWLHSLDRGRSAERTALEALGEVHVHGVRVDWSAFDRPFPRRRVDIPSYPFQHESFWFEPPASALSPKAEARASTRSESAMPTTQPPIAQPSSSDAILANLIAETGQILELQPEQIDPRTPFLEMGADSIALVHLVRYIEDSYGVQMQLRSLFEEITTLSQLASHLDHTAPRRPSEAEAPISAETTAADRTTELAGGSAGAAASSDVVGLMERQLETLSAVMRQQLETLSAVGGAGQRTSEPSAASSSPALPFPTSTATRCPTEVSAGADAKSSPGDNPFGMDRFAEERALEPEQERYLQALRKRYVGRTRSSRDYVDEHRSRWADLRMAMTFRPEAKELCYPIVGERSEGARVVDPDGNEYVDIAMGFGVNLFGHN
ncbi:MAG: phosphopantetheine-binding protein, partial [Planctomycetota bacterium]